MKLKETMIAWNPGTDQVKLGPFPDKTGWLSGYLYDSGACYSVVHNIGERDRQHFVLNLAIKMTVRDKVPVDVVHAAMCEIDEYRDCMSEDTPMPNERLEKVFRRECGQE